MGYHVVDPETLDETPDRPCAQWTVGDAAGLSNFALNKYRAEPGETIPLAYHSHDEQEEAFVVVEGTLHVETPEGDHVVAEGEVFAVEPGSPHRAHNPADAEGPVSVFAIGAPRVDDATPYEP
ncbi:cupin domain-containing protein [Halobacteriaceae archaeon GCM10025711]